MPASVIRLEVEAKEFQQITKALGATHELAEKTFVTVLRRNQKWLATQIRRDIAKATKIPVGAVKRRQRLRLATKAKLNGSIWIGLNPVTLRSLKPSVGKKTGARWKGESWPHAFEVDVGTTRQIFQRRGRKRKPIDVVLYPIEQKALRVIEGRRYDEAQRRLLDDFTRLLQVRMDKQ